MKDRNDGVSYENLLKRYKWSESGIYSSCKKYETTATMENKRGRGRKPKTSAREDSMKITTADNVPSGYHKKNRSNLLGTNSRATDSQYIFSPLFCYERPKSPQLRSIASPINEKTYFLARDREYRNRSAKHLIPSVFAYMTIFSCSLHTQSYNLLGIVNKYRGTEYYSVTMMVGITFSQQLQAVTKGGAPNPSGNGKVFSGSTEIPLHQESSRPSALMSAR
ncbi:hypothetical protein AVEN_110608-1 [Araneus ventricosus]|uniref:Uncharacterized protein n=1 Tax=Araneus ventricosus TaxID=182803 RepID=A0A4Y2AU81_ARAVE|nr:hypothetical protein AVEN_110608-1 [Araneus ventricosus]